MQESVVKARLADLGTSVLTATKTLEELLLIAAARTTGVHLESAASVKSRCNSTKASIFMCAPLFDVHFHYSPSSA